MKLLWKVFAVIRKYRVFDILYWTFSTVELYHLYQQYGKHHELDVTYVAIVKGFEIACVYTMLFFLVPRYLDRKRPLAFIGLAVLSIIAYSLLQFAGKDIGMYVVNGRHLRSFSYLFLITSNLVDNFINCSIFFGVVVIPDKLQAVVRNSRLEKERLETELNFLKLQINPHFLFNAINSIYVLIEEDKKLASEVLLKFSSLLRYQLYDCSKATMPLHSEVNFLNDYIALESLRCGDAVEVTINIDQQIGHSEIPPFILIPFVENSFKHISHHAHKPNYINMHLYAKDGHVFFKIENSFENYGTEVIKRPDSGIGLQNVRRRLELLYPGSHILDIQRDHERFAVDLKLKINETAVYTG